MSADAHEHDRIGAVAIGRNEGERLVRCLRSLVGRVGTVVYVDSGSSDGSVKRARELGAAVVELDASLPFTAARGRNAGFAQLLELMPATSFVQFVDGDCEVVEDWLEAGAAHLEAHADVAVVCGRRRERHRARSVYNRLCDMEWDTPVGEIEACHGDAMMRVATLCEAGGFRDDLIAGEEPELCVRLRQGGWRIVRLDREMTRHDAAMTRFGQWWKRARRAGHAYAEGAWLHGRSADRHNVRPVISILAWAVAMPALALGLAWPTGGWSVLLLLGYLLLGWRVYRWRRRKGDARGDAAWYALFNVLGKFAEATGAITFAWRRFILRRSSTLLEYKGAPASTDASAPATPTRAAPRGGEGG